MAKPASVGPGRFYAGANLMQKLHKFTTLARTLLNETREFSR
jgi:hypothetical protein